MRGLELTGALADPRRRVCAASEWRLRPSWLLKKHTRDSSSPEVSPSASMKRSASESWWLVCSYSARMSAGRSACSKNERSHCSGWWRSAKPPALSERMKFNVIAACS